MPGEQKEIYYLTGESRELLEQSPLLESFKAKGWEVLLLTDPVDEFVVDSLHEYKGKKLKAIDKVGSTRANISDEQKTQYSAVARLSQGEAPRHRRRPA